MNNHQTKQFNPADKAVLITGCSSGIGRAAAVNLAGQGFTVFATVRKEGDAQALAALCLPGLVPVCPVDLARREDIDRAAGFVAAELGRRGLTGLYGLINNAGGGSLAPVELLDLDQFQAELQARILGPVALAQAFLPLIRLAGGRLLWVVTPGLIPTPYVSSIHACDFAVNCLARTLAIELKPWSIPSVMIRCGGIQTASVEKTNLGLRSDLGRWPREKSELYAAALAKNQASLAEFDRKRTPAEAVARVVFSALAASHPRARYRVGYMSAAAGFLESLPAGLADRLIAGWK